MSRDDVSREDDAPGWTGDGASGDDRGARLLQAVRFDPSDTFAFPLAAEPGEWVVPGGFAFRAEPEGGAERQAFANGWLAPSSGGRSTFAAVARATPDDEAALLAALTQAIAALGAPPGPAEKAAEVELAFARDLAEAPVGTVLALRRFVIEGELRETFHTIDAEATSHARVWEIVE